MRKWLTIPLTAAACAATAAQAEIPEREDDDTYEVWELVYPGGTCLEPAAVEKAPITAEGVTPEILGRHTVDARTLWLFVKERNEDFPLEIAEAYISVGAKYGIRGDMALCQAIIETGWFKFADGTAVTPDQYNYCGLGVTRRGLKGHSFGSIKEGVTAQLQHLYAYATTTPLPRGEKVVDPRFGLVSRGCAPTWHALSNRWAANSNYGKQIMTMYARLLEYAGAEVANK